MIRFALTNPSVFVLLRRLPVIRALFSYNMAHYTDTLSAHYKKEIFASFYVSDGTTRQSWPERFDDLNPFTIEFLTKLPTGPVHDIAAADGATSLRLEKQLYRNNCRRQFYVSDKYSRIIIEKSLVPRVFDMHGSMIAAYVGCFAGERCHPVFVVNRMLYLLLRKAMRDGGGEVHTLWSPEVCAAIEMGWLIEMEFDLFTSRLQQEFSFVRCMNVLNSGYFTDVQIVTALRTISAGLTEGGGLLIGRTMPDGKNNATFFRKEKKGYVVVQHCNNGYECAELLLGILV